MKKLEIKQMEEIQGGGRDITAQCAVSLAGALATGIIATIGIGATGGLGALALGMAQTYFGWGMAAWTCMD